jgi:zinc protease
MTRLIPTPKQRSRAMLTRRSLLRFTAAAPALLALRAYPAAAASPIERVVSPGGIEAWLIVDRSVPLLSMSFSFRGGSVAVPPGREGLAPMTAGLLTEGAGDLDSNAFNEIVENGSITIDFDADADSLSGTWRALHPQRDEAVRLAALALTQPRFDQQAIDRLRAQLITQVRRAANDPGAVASRILFSTAFSSHPYGRRTRGTAETLAAITRDDLVAFHRARYARDNLKIGVVGDIAANELGPLIDRIFGGLPARAAPVDVPLATMAGGGQTLLAELRVPQTTVMFAENGVLRHDPDYYAALVMNYILGGGGFGSWLMTEVRERRGLTYGVGTGLAVYDRAALIYGSMSCENRVAAQALALVRTEWGRMAAQGPSADELADAKLNINGSFPLQLDSTGRVAQILNSIQYQNLGIDFLERRAGLIDAVTLDQVKRVGARLLHPDRLLSVAVGQPEGMTGTTVPRE